MAGLNPTVRYLQKVKEGRIDFSHREHLEGVMILPGLSASDVSELKEKVIIRPDDVFIVTYPKCGTTWMQQIVKLMANNGVENGIDHDVFIPWIELMTLEEIESMSSPRFFKSHLPYHLMPGGGDPANTKAKYIYVIRNPKDAAVSGFAHMKKMLPPQIPLTFTSAFKGFAEGKIPYGSFHAHFLGWWSHRDSVNILIVTYEQVKRDLPSVVKSVSTFLGYNLTDEVICKIAEQTTFDNMKKNPAANKVHMDSVFLGEGEFMRKGVIGDWRNVLSTEQSARIDAIVADKLGGSGLVFDYGDEYYDFSKLSSL